uniref:Molybdenum cofactor biosynthesis protein MoaE n=1 Tax=Geoglobus ahangari TaxID=113653 RepID=A0A7C4S684_9EURY
MRAFILKTDWKKIKKELKKKGKAILIKKGEEAEEGVTVGRDKVTLSIECGNLREILEILADLGYDFAALEGFTKEEVENLGIDIPEVTSVDDVERAEDYETLKSLIIKLKGTKGSEFCGALGVFIGFVRKISTGKEVVRLEYERYDEIYPKILKEIENEIMKFEGVRGVKIYHRIGVLTPPEDIVYVIVMAENRETLWKPLQVAVELMKKKLPIWKKEVYVDGEIWVHDKT